MSNELTWEQEQDIAEYEQWQAEQAWEAKLQDIIKEDELAQEAEQEMEPDEYPDYDWELDDHTDYASLAAYYDGAITGR